MNLPNLPIPHHPSQSILDSTKLQTYQDCPRQFFYEYLLGWRSARPNNHLVFGDAVHQAIEHILLHGYRQQSIIEAFDIFNNVYRSQFDEYTDLDCAPKTPSNFFLMMTDHYLPKYGDDLERYEVVKTEFGGTVHLSDTHILAFKMDTILRDLRDNTFGSLEHKTKGGNYIDKAYAIDHKMGIQVGTYTHVLNTLFHPSEVSCVTINCMCFKKTKTPSFILERFPIFMSNEEMYIWLETTKSWMDKLYLDLEQLSTETDSQDILKSFPCNGRACSNWGRICTFNDLCTSWPNPLQHLDHRPIDMEVNFWNPLDKDLREVLDL